MTDEVNKCGKKYMTRNDQEIWSAWPRGASLFGAAEIRVGNLVGADKLEVGDEKQVQLLVVPGRVYMQRL